MEIRDKTVMVLGGWGLVGLAVCRRILLESPRRIVVLSLRKEESRQACAMLACEAGSTELIPEWGDVFALNVFKDRRRAEIIGESALRRKVIDALYDALTPGILHSYFLNRTINRHAPHVIVDCINTATGLAYQDVYKTVQRARKAQARKQDLTEHVDMLMLTDAIPQLIRHVQILYQSMIDAGTQCYFKVGTSGTGGMGLNIPYTHSEERPSRTLLSKSALAGAQSLLLFLMARTPGGLITKEVKPAAAIAWKRIEYGEVPGVSLVDCPPEKALKIGRTFRPRDRSCGRPLGTKLESVFIDTGENGIFSLEEFSALTTLEQMEFVTPEEIADNIVFEIKGGNTGHDIINALDNAAMGPTYRAGLMRHSALEKMRQLEDEHGCHSLAFELLGPPRLSKLIFEAHLLRLNYGTMEEVATASPGRLSTALARTLRENSDLRSQIISIGIPILWPDGTMSRGPVVKTPPVVSDDDTFKADAETIDRWAESGWVDLRLANCRKWRDRFAKILKEADEISPRDTSSRHLRGRQFWTFDGFIQPGKIVGWIFATEEKGARMK